MRTLLPFHIHLPELLVLLAAAFAYVRVTKTRRQRSFGVSGFAVLAVVTMWPIGDLAASVSLTVATVQRLVIVLFVAPMLLLGMTPSTLARLSRPRLLDVASQVVTRPGVAIARAAYVFVSALVVTSLSFVWIFAHHSLYPGLAHQKALLGMTPLLDQQLAGFVSKLGCYFPMWTVAFTIFSRADDQGIPLEDSPLHWADVERELLRVDRRRAKALRSGGPA